MLAADLDYIDPLAGSFNRFNVKTNKSDPSTTPFLSRADVQAKIGAVGNYTEDNIFVAYNFETSGAWIRNTRPLLEDLINKGVQTTMWAGDAVRAQFSTRALGYVEPTNARRCSGPAVYRTSKATT